MPHLHTSYAIDPIALRRLARTDAMTFPANPEVVTREGRPMEGPHAGRAAYRQ